MAPPAASAKQWMLGLPGHNEVMRLDEVLLLLKGGQLRPTDLVKKLGEPWRAANEIPDLMEYFSDPKKMAGIADGPGISTKPPEEKPMRQGAKAPSPNTTRIPSPPAASVRPTTARAMVPERKPAAPSLRPATALSSAPTQRAEVRASEAPKAETQPPEASKGDTRPPDPLKTEAKPADPLNVGAKLTPIVDKPRETRSRPLPKPPRAPAVRLEPMVAKYFGPVDLLRSASLAFEPKKLLMAAIGVTPLGILSGVLWHFSGDRDTVREWALALLGGVLWVFGFAFLWTALAYLTRRQLEGKEYKAADVVGYATSNMATSVVYPLLSLLPSLASLAVLWILRSIRNSSTGGASFLKIAYFIPMAFAFLAVAGALLYQIASMYIPAAAAIEGQGLGGAISAAWDNMRRQWGRVVLHWLIITVAVGVISAVSLGLAIQAVFLPEVMFGRPDDRIRDAWNNFGALFSIYKGLAFGLGLTLPVSLLSTLGTLSYMSLRHPGSAQLSPAPLDETSGIALHGTRSGSSNPAEATQPGETRPAPPDATPPPPISDDSDEQPLVKEA